MRIITSIGDESTRGTYPLICDALCGLFHELLDGFNVHLLVDLREDLIPLLESVQDVLLDQ